MKIGFIGNDVQRYIDALHQEGYDAIHIATVSQEEIAEQLLSTQLCFLKDYYEHIELYTKNHNNLIVLTTTFFPYNQGSDSHLWSFVEDTPIGVSIYRPTIDKTSKILIQKRVELDEYATLKTSKQQLENELFNLFRQTIKSLVLGTLPNQEVTTKGTYHTSANRTSIEYLIKQLGEDTPIQVLWDYAAENQMSADFWDDYFNDVSNQ